MVTPAPSSTRPEETAMCSKLGSVERTIVSIAGSASLTARMTSVPPPRKRAPRSLDSAPAASAKRAKVLTVTLMRGPPIRTRLR